MNVLGVSHLCFVFLLITPHMGNEIIFTNDIKRQRCPDVAFIDRSKEYCSIAGCGPLHTYFKVWDMLFIEDSTMTLMSTTS